jgi:hypothetical protein
MRFEIKGDKQKIKNALDNFIVIAKQEYEVQMKRALSIPLPMGMSMKDLAPIFEIGYLEEADSIILWDTITGPKLLKPLMKRAVDKAERNLQNFFKALDIPAEIHYIGDLPEKKKEKEDKDVDSDSKAN